MKMHPMGAAVFLADGRTDRETDRWTCRHGEANNNFLHFCERA